MESKKKFRKTEPRRVILQEIKNLKSHPTADDMYEIVRKRVPRVSLGTIYRNLEVLCQEGLIQKIEVGGSQKRFDGHTENHYHFRCLNCGKVEDITQKPMKEIESALPKLYPYEILGHHLELIGRCSNCNTERQIENPISEDEGEIIKGDNQWN
jgi:Fur family transcriptional regulator, ferric uptake regulator